MYRKRLENIKTILMRKQVELDSHKEKVAEYERLSSESLQRLKDIEGANAIVSSVALELQDSVREKVQSIVQKALDATFPEKGYTFRMKYVTRRDKVDTDMLIEDRDGNEQNILYGNGGGVKDIVSFALRVAVWSLDESASPIVILDEPMKFMSAGCRNQGAELLEILGRDLGLQFIVVSHVPEIIENASRVFKVQKDADEVSHARLIR